MMTTYRLQLLTTYCGCARDSSCSHRGVLQGGCESERVEWVLLALSPSCGLFDIVRWWTTASGSVTTWRHAPPFVQARGGVVKGNLRLWETIAGPAALFPACYLQ